MGRKNLCSWNKQEYELFVGGDDEFLEAGGMDLNTGATVPLLGNNENNSMTWEQKGETEPISPWVAETYL